MVPVTQGGKSEFVVNLATARTLCLTIAPQVLARATNTID
jgi:hypothetical protein